MTRPNIIFIMSDDHAAAAISACGSGLNRTPQNDRLAAEDMRMEHCHVSNSTCTPSRAAILTGTYNHVNPVTTLDTHLDNRLPNVARHLQKGGHQTAIFGKWHLGEGAADHPTGFDAWAMLPGQGDCFDPAFHTPEGEEVAPGHAADINTDKSIDFLARRDQGRPFFLMCHHKAQQRRFVPYPRYNDLYAEDLPVPATHDARQVGRM